MAKLTSKARNKLPLTTFGLPGNVVAKGKLSKSAKANRKIRGK